MPVISERRLILLLKSQRETKMDTACFLKNSLSNSKEKSFATKEIKWGGGESTFLIEYCDIPQTGIHADFSETSVHFNYSPKNEQKHEKIPSYQYPTNSTLIHPAQLCLEK